jgi:hypothetical protein
MVGAMGACWVRVEVAVWCVPAVVGEVLRRVVNVMRAAIVSAARTVPVVQRRRVAVRAV